MFSHFGSHREIPSLEVIYDNTGIVLPHVDQPTSYYLTRLKQRALTRNIREPYQKLVEALQNPRTQMLELTQSIDELAALKTRFIERGTGIETSQTLLADVMHQYRLRQGQFTDLAGITTGLAEVDSAMDGYNPGDLVVWLARPGRAKSWFLLKQCYAAWQAGHKPLYISMEMGGVQNMRRLIGIHSGINPTFIRRGQVQSLFQPILERAVNELMVQRPLHMATANFSRTIDQVAALCDQYEPDILFIDAGYLLSPHKVRYGSSSRRETVSDVVEELKELGMNLNIPVVITSQFNRQADVRRRAGPAYSPIAHLSLSEIGETDVIGQVASHVFGIDFLPAGMPHDEYRVFGFLKGREGESGWWITNFMRHQWSPVRIDVLERSDPIYARLDAILNETQAAEPRTRRNPRDIPPEQRTDFMRLNQAV